VRAAAACRRRSAWWVPRTSAFEWCRDSHAEAMTGFPLDRQRERPITREKSPSSPRFGLGEKECRKYWRNLEIRSAFGTAGAISSRDRARHLSRHSELAYARGATVMGTAAIAKTADSTPAKSLGDGHLLRRARPRMSRISARAAFAPILSNAAALNNRPMQVATVAHA